MKNPLSQITILALLFCSFAATFSHAQTTKNILSPSEIEIKESRIDGWLVYETAVPNPRYRVLLLPGLFESDRIYAPLMHSKLLFQQGIQLVAADPPGFKGEAAGDSFNYSVISFARVLSQIESELKFDLVVGHSFFADVLIEVMKTAGPDKKFLLLSPSLRHQSECTASRLLNWASRAPVANTVAWSVTYSSFNTILSDGLVHKNSDTVSDLAADARRTSIDQNRQLLIGFFDYIDSNHNLADVIRLSASKVWFAYAQGDVIEVRPDDIQSMQLNRNVDVVEIPDSGHMSMVDNPAAIGSLIQRIVETHPADSMPK
jgi:pimeloyl-ACP methyl ester carboxylesterase